MNSDESFVMPPVTADFSTWRDEAAAIAIDAGALILRHYAQGFTVTDKPDGSPVTAADLEADALIAARLGSFTGSIPIVSEESIGGRTAADFGRRYWMVDPLDGTREFVARTDDFCVNIALMEDGFPTFGIIHVPVENKTYAGSHGRGAWLSESAGRWRSIAVAPRMAEEGIRLINSRRTGKGEKTRAFLNGVPMASLTNRGSALKFGVIAAGEADLYTRFGPTGEWDTAAGQAVLEAAGGSVSTEDGRRLSYGKPDFLNPAFIAIGGCRDLFWK